MTDIKKPWYRRPLHSILLVLAAVLLSMLAFFIYQVFYYAVAIKKGDFSAFNGEIVDIRQLATPGQVNRTQLETRDDPNWGPINAKVVVVQFSEFFCPYSKENEPVIRKIKEEYSDRVRFIFRDFPITAVHPNAMIAAEAGHCADEQGRFWLYHDLLFSRQDELQTKADFLSAAEDIALDPKSFSACQESGRWQGKVMQNLQDGILFDVKGTPTYFFNGQKVSGVLSYETFKEILDNLLKRS